MRIKKSRVLKQLRHKRFTTLNDALASIICYWYVQIQSSFEPIGNLNYRIHRRRCTIYT